MFCHAVSIHQFNYYHAGARRVWFTIFESRTYTPSGWWEWGCIYIKINTCDASESVQITCMPIQIVRGSTYPAVPQIWMIAEQSRNMEKSEIQESEEISKQAGDLGHYAFALHIALWLRMTVIWWSITCNTSIYFHVRTHFVEDRAQK